MPETRGKRVEEMGEISGDTVDVHITSDGRGLVEKSEAVVEEAEIATPAPMGERGRSSSGAFQYSWDYDRHTHLCCSAGSKRKRGHVDHLGSR